MDSVIGRRLKEIACKQSMEGCSLIRCHVDSLRKDESVLIEISARVFLSTIITLQKVYRRVLVSSEATMQWNNSRHAVVQEEKLRIETFIASVGADSTQEPVEFWVIIVGLASGSIFLFLITMLLWKCGFFKRKTIPEDKQALNNEEKTEESSIDN